jgi:hypothetical protein
MRPKNILAPKVTIGQPEEQGRISPIRKRPTQQALIRFAIMAGNAYFEAMPLVRLTAKKYVLAPI